MVKSRGVHATSAAVAVAVATLLACTAALPQREQEVDRLLAKMSGDHTTDSRYDSGGGQKVRNLDALGGGNLVRGVRQAHPYLVPYISGRSYEYLSPFAGKREIMVRPFQYRDLGSIYADVPKRNFDEIDRTGFDSFVKKRNFDEIDRTGFGTFVKRAASDSDIYSLPPYALPLRFYDREH